LINIKTVKAIILVIAGSLTGCGDGAAFWSSPEEKINAAFPVSEDVRLGRMSLLKDAPEVQIKGIELQLNSRLKLRALNCAKGYSPSWHSSTNDIRKKLGTSACFAETDGEIRKWLGLLRVGIILAKPALKSSPKTAPSFLVADAFIVSAQFAENAAVALLESEKSISIVDFESTKPMFREPRGAAVGKISPNGRLFVTGDASGAQLKIRDSESGVAIAEIPLVRFFEFHWLDVHTAIFISRDSRKTFLLDFDAGQEITVEGISSGFDQAVQVPGVQDQYVLFTHAGVSKIQLVRGQTEPEVRIVAEKPMSAMGCARNTSGKTADGTRFFCASRNFTLVSLASLEIESVTLDPFQIQWGVASPDPDQILLKGFVQPSHGENGGEYLYSIANHTMTKIDRDRVMSDRFAIINSIQRQAVINQNKIEIVSDLPKLAPISAQAFASSAQEIVNNRKLDAVEERSLQGVARSGQLIQTPLKSAAKGPLVDLARDAQVEAVGVYQGASGGSKTPDGRKLGYVEVRIRRSTKPIVLVLSSYEPVRWMLISESGARLAAVLVSSYYPSQVVGAGSVPVVVNGSTFAYKTDGSGYRALNQAVSNVIGKDIGVFQGRYDGGQFSVGSIARW
jgi:hypothetical protein